MFHGTWCLALDGVPFPSYDAATNVPIRQQYSLSFLIFNHNGIIMSIISDTATATSKATESTAANVIILVRYFV